MGDETFVENFSQARKYGFIRGAYHYFLPKTDAHKQADFLLVQYTCQKETFPPFLMWKLRVRRSPLGTEICR